MKLDGEDPMGFWACPRMFDADWLLDDVKFTFAQYDPKIALKKKN